MPKRLIYVDPRQFDTIIIWEKVFKAKLEDMYPEKKEYQSIDDIRWSKLKVIAKSSLTPQQYAVFLGLSHGMRSVDIAKKLDISKYMVYLAKKYMIKKLRKKYKMFESL